jgi:hypothetical protein
MYDPESYLVANEINRYALGDRSGLTYADDGSLTLSAALARHASRLAREPARGTLTASRA